MCFDFYPEAGGWLSSECSSFLFSSIFKSLFLFQQFLLFWLTNFAVFSSISTNFSVSKFPDFFIILGKIPWLLQSEQNSPLGKCSPIYPVQVGTRIFWLQHIFTNSWAITCSSPHCNSSQLKIVSNWRLFVTNLLQMNKLIAANWWPVKNPSTVKPVYDGHWMATCLARPLYEVNLLCNSICKSTCLYGQFLLKILVVVQSRFYCTIKILKNIHTKYFWWKLVHDRCGFGETGASCLSTNSSFTASTGLSQQCTT